MKIFDNQLAKEVAEQTLGKEGESRNRTRLFPDAREKSKPKANSPKGADQ